MGVFDKKFKELIAEYDQANQQNEMEQAKLQSFLASRFRLSQSEIGQALVEMMEKDQARRINQRKISIR
jgi:hypothetical protein